VGSMTVMAMIQFLSLSSIKVDRSEGVFGAGIVHVFCTIFNWNNEGARAAS
jgi:hypothetical protein